MKKAIIVLMLMFGQMSFCGQQGAIVQLQRPGVAFKDACCECCGEVCCTCSKALCGCCCLIILTNHAYIYGTDDFDNFKIVSPKKME
ncbi:MAG: hypothetical protein WC747_01220 [Candidatus Babeliales bacterium]|jgi:hypothetical protein